LFQHFPFSILFPEYLLRTNPPTKKMKRKIEPGDFGISLYIARKGVLDFRILYPDKEGLRKAGAMVQLLSPYLLKFEARLEEMSEEDWGKLSAPAEIRIQI
jgi:hypothetical protein